MDSSEYLLFKEFQKSMLNLRSKQDKELLEMQEGYLELYRSAQEYFSNQENRDSYFTLRKQLKREQEIETQMFNWQFDQERKNLIFTHKENVKKLKTNNNNTIQ